MPARKNEFKKFPVFGNQLEFRIYAALPPEDGTLNHPERDRASLFQFQTIVCSITVNNTRQKFFNSQFGA
jgi:hypothetical protein